MKMLTVRDSDMEGHRHFGDSYVFISPVRIFVLPRWATRDLTLAVHRLRYGDIHTDLPEQWEERE